MTDAKGNHEPTLVERWLQEQQHWQRTLLTYVDSMAKDDEFLVNLGNAMRGSLLAGKAYPSATTTPPSQSDDRLDRVLFALNTLQGQMQDVLDSVEALRKSVTPATAAVRKPARKPASTRPPLSKRTRKGRA